MILLELILKFLYNLNSTSNTDYNMFNNIFLENI